MKCIKTLVAYNPAAGKQAMTSGVGAFKGSKLCL